MSLLDQHRLPRLEIRAPTTDPLLDRGTIARFIRERVSPTGVHEPTVLMLNLDGRFLNVGALYELIVPLGQAVKAGQYGPLSVVISTPDEATREAVKALADRFELPIYLSTTTANLNDARPATTVTGTQDAVMEALRRRGGRATVAELTAEVGSAHGAVSNILTDLADSGLLLRIAGAGRRGHLYLDPVAAVPAEQPAHPESLDFDVPADVRDDVRALAEIQGREPGAVLIEAWREFLTKHREHLTAQSSELSQHRDREDSNRRDAESNVGRPPRAERRNAGARQRQA